MPHIIVEYSKNLSDKINVEQILHTCLEVASQSQLFDMASVEARAFEVPYGFTTKGETSSIHIKIALFPGRDSVKLTALSKAMYENVLDMVNQPANLSTQVVEIDPQFCFHN